MTTDEETVCAWQREFLRTPASTALSASARLALPGAAHVLARRFRRRWDRVEPTPYPLADMTADDVVDLLTRELPRTVATLDGAAIVDGLVALLIWAAKHGRVAHRDVEYACRRVRRAALAAMDDERAWSAGVSIVRAALRDGVDGSDLAVLRAHAIARGSSPEWADEFLPPGPTWAGGRWLWLDGA
jgi:hypothetical protein